MQEKNIEEKILQVVNLSPDPIILQKFEQMHPMRMVFWASITQICVLGFMALCMQIIHFFTWQITNQWDNRYMRLLEKSYGEVRIFSDRPFGYKRYIVETPESTQIYSSLWYKLDKIKEFVEKDLNSKN